MTRFHSLFLHYSLQHSGNFRTPNALFQKIFKFAFIVLISFYFQVPDNTTQGNQCENSFSKECCSGRDGENRNYCFRSLVLLIFTAPLCFRTNSIFSFLILGRDGRDGQHGKKQLFNNFSPGSEEDHRHPRNASHQQPHESFWRLRSLDQSSNTTQILNV